MHRIRVCAGVAGVVFTVGSLAIFLVGVPALWAFLVLSIGLGLIGWRDCCDSRAPRMVRGQWNRSNRAAFCF